MRWVSTPATSSLGSATGACGIPASTGSAARRSPEWTGEILEIGFGTGLNLEHYPEHVRHLTAIDPGEGMARIARRRIERSEHRRGPSRPDRRGVALRGRAASTAW